VERFGLDSGRIGRELRARGGKSGRGGRRLERFGRQRDGTQGGRKGRHFHIRRIGHIDLRGRRPDHIGWRDECLYGRVRQFDRDQIRGFERGHDGDNGRGRPHHAGPRGSVLRRRHDGLLRLHDGTQRTTFTRRARGSHIRKLFAELVPDDLFFFARDHELVFARGARRQCGRVDVNREHQHGGVDRHRQSEREAAPPVFELCSDRHQPSMPAGLCPEPFSGARRFIFAA
jgi:hypothetical protein